ncbi:MAG: arsenate reductase ArsC [Planctomycetota bacterium]|nr:arsenate reductase ArsC [Planctomycetota bacterium]MDA1142920.1 arsenate reductase ArsC [Planctomycetota bacterium]
MESQPSGILILCTGNSCRSQMAEGIIRHLAPTGTQVFSAGVEPAGYVHEFAIKVMKEIGRDISSHRSKNVSEVPTKCVDLVLTVCGHAEETCPAYLDEVRRVHWPLSDPAKAEGTEEEIMDVFRNTRNDIEKRSKHLLGIE